MRSFTILFLILAPSLFAKSEPRRSRGPDSIHNIEERYYGGRAEGLDPDAVPFFSPKSWLEGRLHSRAGERPDRP